MKLEDYIISEDGTIREAMEKINRNARGILFLCRDGILKAALSDGDIRRSIVRSSDLEIPVRAAANYQPKYLKHSRIFEAEEYMRRHVITAVPIVDDAMVLTDIRFLLKKPDAPKAMLKNQVVIMAGGKGARLKPYTDILPKPLIPIGEKTIAEHILEHFERYGCSDFHMIVNYKKNLIKSYFADCEKQWGITFTEEDKFCGTGGGLSLLKGAVIDTFFMTNCDILIEADYEELLNSHREQGNIITLVCAKKTVTMPYGTIETAADGSVCALREKPSFTFQTNTGLYVIEPAFLDKIPDDTFIDITDVIQRCIDEGERVGIYGVEEEKWMDMGQIEEMETMKERLGILS